MSGITFQPGMYYEVTARDTNEACSNYDQTFNIPQFYSNAGSNCYVQCGVCGQHMEILTATLLDPQPEVT